MQAHTRTHTHTPAFLFHPRKSLILLAHMLLFKIHLQAPSFLPSTAIHIPARVLEMLATAPHQYPWLLLCQDVPVFSGPVGLGLAAVLSEDHKPGFLVALCWIVGESSSSCRDHALISLQLSMNERLRIDRQDFSSGVLDARSSLCISGLG